jgi:hypothetical protein
MDVKKHDDEGVKRLCVCVYVCVCVVCVCVCVKVWNRSKK